MRKKFLCLLVSGLMVFSSSNVSVFAEEDTEVNSTADITETSEADEELNTETTEQEISLQNEETEPQNDPVYVAYLENGDHYETLAEAIKNAPYGARVNLEADVNENIVIEEGQDIELNLNGKTLNGGTAAKAPAILNKGRLTITDASDNAGKIMREDKPGDGSASYYVIDNQGTMTVNGGTITNHSDYSSLIRNAGKGKNAALLIGGGIITQDEFTAVKNDDLGELIINGGVINSASSSAVQSWATTTISGGTLNGTLYVSHWSDEFDSKTVVNNNAVINGDVIVRNHTSGLAKEAQLGIFDGTMNVSNWRLEEGAKVTIGGGEFAQSVPESSYITYTAEYTAVAYVEGQPYQTLQEAINAAEDNARIRLVKDVHENVSFKENKELTLDLNGHSILGNEEGWVIDITAENQKKVTIDGTLGGKISGGSKTSGVVVARNGEVVLNNVQLESAKGYGVASINETTKVSINGGSVSGNIAATAQKGGTLNIDGTKITAKNTVIEGRNGIININETTESKTVLEGAYGIMLYNHPYDNSAEAKSSSLNMTGGTISTNYFAISGNNLRSAGSKVEITGGTVECKGVFAGIYWPMEGVLTIGGNAHVTGGTAVDVRMGEITVKEDAVLEGRTDPEYVIESFPTQSGGSWSEGSALRIAAQEYGKAATQYKTSPDLKVNVLGGKFISDNNSISVYNLESITEQNVNIVVSGASFEPADGKVGVKYLSKESDVNATLSVGKATVTSGTTTLNAPAVAISKDKKTVSFYADLEEAIKSADELTVIDDATVSYETLTENTEKLTLAAGVELDVTSLPEDKEVKYTDKGNGTFSVSVADKEKEEPVDPTPVDPTPDPEPVDPTPDPEPVDPTPVDPTPTPEPNPEPTPDPVQPVVVVPAPSRPQPYTPTRPVENEPEEDPNENSEVSSEEIEDPETPLVSEKSSETEEIEDPETPLAPGEKKTNWTLPILGGIAALALIFFIILFKRKKDEEEEEAQTE